MDLSQYTAKGVFEMSRDVPRMFDRSKLGVGIEHKEHGGLWTPNGLVHFLLVCFTY